jgi:hypothetical protein|tara:strand:+ start:137 stop:451 length:315 start_codon:yes stop_codon:yes gene_type:complete
MIKIIVIFTAILTLVAIVYGVAVGVNIVQAEEETVHVHEVIYGQSIIADNHYSQNGNYDIHYDGQTCFRWINDRMPVVVLNPSVVTYSNPIDDSSLLNIIACET